MSQTSEVGFQTSPDVAKMLRDFRVTGGKNVPIVMTGGTVLWGASRFAKVKASDATASGMHATDYPTIVRKEMGKGKIYYCGTNIG
jgi:hypothetical protein